MDKPKITPKDFFLWFGAMVALYAALFSFIFLVFEYLEYAFPDQQNLYYGNPYTNGVAYYMASLIVLTPLFVLLMRVIHKSIERDPSRADLWVRRWALYLTLFFATVTIAGDLITLLMYFFTGEDIVIRFVLKVIVLLLVAGGAFMHFLADLRGYWERNPQKARAVGWAVGLLVVVSIVAGFFVIGTPFEARMRNLDEQKIMDLGNIQYQIVDYWRAKQALPPTLDVLRDPLKGSYIPIDTETGTEYEYNIKGARTFELCATFNTEGRSNAEMAIRTAPVAEPYSVPMGTDNWSHGEGRTCFERTIDPDFYPPLPK